MFEQWPESEKTIYYKELRSRKSDMALFSVLVKYNISLCNMVNVKAALSSNEVQVHQNLIQYLGKCIVVLLTSTWNSTNFFFYLYTHVLFSYPVSSSLPSLFPALVFPCFIVVNRYTHTFLTQ